MFTSESLAGLLTGLGTQVNPDGTLRDPLHDGSGPVDHYAQTCAALAFLIHDDPDRHRWRVVFDAWLALEPSRLGHLPFNRFMLLLLGEELARCNAPDQDLRRIERGLVRCKLRKYYPSNNWSLLAQLCRVIESATRRLPLGKGEVGRGWLGGIFEARYPLCISPLARGRKTRRFGCLLDRWTTSEGAFIDYPARPKHDGATPITYHHKALFLATTAAWFCDDPVLTPRIQRLLSFAILSWDGDGYAGGLGRSTHALFGDGCLLAALILLDLADHDMVEGIMLRLESQRREDGLYWLNPAGAAGRAGWDDYMFLSVYNAWFAAVVSWSMHVRKTRAMPECLQGIKSPPWQGDTTRPPPPNLPLAKGEEHVPPFEKGGLGGISGRQTIKLTTKTLTALITTHGQPPQAFSRTEAEFRYSGGIPFHARVGGRIIIPPPVRVELQALLHEPALAGWTPVFRVRGRVYGLTDFESVAVRESDETIRIELRGCPTAMTRRPVQGVWGRTRAALDWRLFDGALGRREALRRDTLGTLEGRIVLTVHARESALSYHLVLDNRSREPVQYLNPAGHALVRDALPRRYHVSGTQGTTKELAMALMPSSIAGAKGYCLPALELPRGRTDYSIDLRWDESA